MRKSSVLTWIAAALTVVTFWLADIGTADARIHFVSTPWARVLLCATACTTVLVGVAALFSYNRRQVRRDGEAARSNDRERLDEIEDGLRQAYRAARWPDPGDVRRQRDVREVQNLA